jgi:hypothetical protein
MSSRSKLSVLVRSGRRDERADRRRPECDEVAAVVRDVQRLDWPAPRDIQERDRAVPQPPQGTNAQEEPHVLDVHHAPDRTGHPRPDCPHKRICLETPLPLSDGCKRPERLLADSRSGRPASALSGQARTTAITGRSGHESLGGSDSFWSSEQARARRQRRRPLVNGAAVAPPASPGGRCLCSAVVRETGRLVLSRAWALGFGSVKPSVAAEQVEAVGGGRARRLGH